MAARWSDPAVIVVIVAAVIAAVGGIAAAIITTSGSHDTGSTGSTAARPKPPTTTASSPNDRSPSTPATTSGIRTEIAANAADTFTNYLDAGGRTGPDVPAGPLRISCRVKGLKVGHGNLWWYRIASPPWRDNFYVSADPFYNNGQTSGPLKNTPDVDLRVPVC